MVRKTNKSNKVDIKVIKTKGKTVLPAKEAKPVHKQEVTKAKSEQRSKLKPLAQKLTGLLAELKKQQRVSVLGDGIVKDTNAIVRQHERGAPHGVVIARAGTGKTFTLVTSIANCYRKEVWGQLVQRVGFNPEPSDQQQVVWDFVAQEKPRTITYIAFNNSIVREFEAKWKWLTDALQRFGVYFNFSTIHALGNTVTGRQYRFGWKAVNSFNVRNLLELEWQKQEWFRGKSLRDLDYETWKQKSPVIYAVEELVGLCKLTLTYHEKGGLNAAENNSLGQLIVSDSELEELALRYGIEMNGCQSEVFELVNILLNKSRRPGDNGVKNFDFNDQIWLPVVNNTAIPQVDLLLVDEGQDLCRCQQELALRAGRRILLVGDDRQAIYGFAGADTDSIPRMQTLLGDERAAGSADDSDAGSSELLRMTSRGCVTMKLTETRRCGKAIVAEANKIVPDFTAYSGNGTGKVSDMPYDTAWEEYKPDDMVLCRTNAPLMRVAFGLLRENRAVRVQGRNMSEGFKQMIRLSKAESVSDLLTWLDEHLRKQREKLEKRARSDGSATDALIALQDKVQCLRIFCEGATTIKDIYENMERVFQEKVKGQRPPSVLLSSVHRAKGMEASRVFILRPDLMPHKMAKTPEAKAQEENLKYVAITRAIDELVWVVGEAEGVEEE